MLGPTDFQHVGPIEYANLLKSSYNGQDAPNIYDIENFIEWSNLKPNDYELYTGSYHRQRRYLCLVTNRNIPLTQLMIY